MKVKILVILMVLIALIGCVAEINVTPTQEVMYPCEGYPGVEFLILNSNPCLQGAIRTTTQSEVDLYKTVVQWRPELHTIISNPLTINGFSDEYSDHVPIAFGDDGYTFNIMNINGEWGFKLPSSVYNPGCILLKGTGTSEIETEVPSDYYIKAYIETSDSSQGVVINSHQLETNGDWQYIWVLRVNEPLIATMSLTMQAAWRSSSDGGVTLNSIFVSQVDDGYCEGAMEF